MSRRCVQEHGARGGVGDEREYDPRKCVDITRSSVWYANRLLVGCLHVHKTMRVIVIAVYSTARQKTGKKRRSPSSVLAVAQFGLAD